MPSIVMHDKSPSQDSIGDTENTVDCDLDKYSLEMSSTLKSYRIREVTGAKESKI